MPRRPVLCLRLGVSAPLRQVYQRQVYLTVIRPIRSIRVPGHRAAFIFAEAEVVR